MCTREDYMFTYVKMYCNPLQASLSERLTLALVTGLIPGEYIVCIARGFIKGLLCQFNLRKL